MTAARPVGAPDFALRRLAQRSPIALFLALVFGLGYPLMFLPLLAARGIIPGADLPGKIGLDTEKASALLLVLLVLLPCTLIVTALEGGKPALAALLRRATTVRFGARWWAVVFALPVITVLLGLALGDRLKPPTLLAVALELQGAAIGFFVVNLWEEIAWAGFLQTRLERRHNLYVAAALTAVPFALIHMPLQVINGVTDPVSLAVGFALLTVLGLVFRSMLGLLMRGAANSLLAVGLAHTMFNRSNNTEGVAALLLEGGNRQVAALVATVALTVVLGIALRKRTGTDERRRLDVANGEA